MYQTWYRHTSINFRCKGFGFGLLLSLTFSLEVDVSTLTFSQLLVSIFYCELSIKCT